MLGLMLTLTGFYLPAPTKRIAMPVSGLDEFTPQYQFNEIHSRHIDATPDAVYAAVQQVTASEIPLFQTLTWLRRLGRKGPESILNAPDRMPILHVATSTTFLRLYERPPSETVIGTLVHAPAGTRRSDVGTPQLFKEIQRPGFAKAAMNFRIEADPGGGSTIWTETRVFATDPKSRRRFAMYWRVIYPGSALIRRGWLQAIARRAEAIPPAPVTLRESH